MNDPATLRTIIANPVIHDKSDNQYSTKGAPVAPGSKTVKCDIVTVRRAPKCPWEWHA